MDLDEFLSENGIPLGEGALGRSPPTKGISPSRSVASSDGSSGSGLVRGSLALNCNDSSGDSPKPGSSASNRYPESPVNYQRLGFILIIASFVVIIIVCCRIRSPANEPQDDECSNASDSSASSVMDSIIPETLQEARPAASRRKRAAVSISSSVNDNTSDDGIFFSGKMRRKTLSLQLGLSSAGSYVPGQDFDPKSRPFSQEELRPQPMSKKSKKQVQIIGSQEAALKKK